MTANSVCRWLASISKAFMPVPLAEVIQPLIEGDAKSQRIDEMLA